MNGEEISLNVTLQGLTKRIRNLYFLNCYAFLRQLKKKVSELKSVSDTHKKTELQISKYRYQNTSRFQQDGATAHTAVISIAALRGLFPQRVISRFGDVPWPPRSPDLTGPDFFFLWGYLKSKVCSTRPTGLQTLKENILEEIAKLTEETLQAVMRSFLTRVHLCSEEGGGHLKDIVHKKWNCVKKS